MGLQVLRDTIGLKNSSQFFMQWEVKPEPIVIHDSFSRASRQVHAISSSFDWFTYCLCCLWLARVITMVLVLRLSIEKKPLLLPWSWFYDPLKAALTNAGDRAVIGSVDLHLIGWIDGANLFLTYIITER